MDFIANALDKSREYALLRDGVLAGLLPCQITGVSGLVRSAIATSLSQQTDKCGVMVMSDESEAFKTLNEVRSLGVDALYYPAREFTFYDVNGISRELEDKRIAVLYHLINGDCPLIITTVEAFCQYTIPKNKLTASVLHLKNAAELNLESFVQNLVKLGYYHSDIVEGAGQFCKRGGIVDVFSPNLLQPLRVEFWGDEIDSIGIFDVTSQRRIENVTEIDIYPANETAIAQSNLELLDDLQNLYHHTKSSRREAVRSFSNIVLSDIENLQNNGRIMSIDRYASYVFSERKTIADYLDNCLIFINDTNKIRERQNAVVWQHGEDLKNLLEQGRLYGDCCIVQCDIEDFHILAQKIGAVYMDTFAPGTSIGTLKQLRNFAIKNSGNLSISALLDQCEEYYEQNYSVIICASDRAKGENIAAALNSSNIIAPIVDNLSEIPPAKTVTIVLTNDSAFTQSIELSHEKIAIMGVTANTNVTKRKVTSKKQGQQIQSFSDLKEGDYVVHTNHGIGQYLGIVRLDVAGVQKDYIKIKYNGEDVLYVPANQLDLVSKFIGATDTEGKTIKLNRMGSGDWVKAKAKVRLAVRDMADELIKLYSARQQIQGFSFSPDTVWQREFEDAFEYAETDDQLCAAEEIKTDMSKAFPMDRLLCGDVGFGKTEVALRAVFKCVQDGKQAAILVPTTILAWQHYQTIVSRFGNFPVNVEFINRFKNKKQQTEIVKKLKTGEIDLIIGTHRIIQKDIGFKNLGLVVVDEEQRFGVAHKEKLKQMTQNVDVLTLTATPIPRTLNMALSGIRDMSLLEEAPKDRYPVQTYVAEQDDALVFEWIGRELRRGGQVFYLHNRVESIDLAALRISKMYPEARVAVAHGQMGEEALSDVWRAMVANEVDVLVCTTIIETGIDLPNANTLIIENADRFGLSQLHQIRGRVGRSGRRAYAYFLFKRGKVLSEISQRRLTAIREFTEFGAGFKIAMRDLEIRGAGNILGGEQSGHLQSVGYDMYLKLLAEVVAEEQGTPILKSECVVDVAIDAYIPENYIDSSEVRIDVYKKIAAITDDDDKTDLIDELCDRFGDIPKSVVNLIEVALLRNLASSKGIIEIKQQNGAIVLFTKKINKENAFALVKKFKGRLLVGAGNKPYFSMSLRANENVLDVTHDILSEYIV